MKTAEKKIILRKAGIIYRYLTPDDSIHELTELLHRAYKPLQDMGLNYAAANQNEKKTRERISKGTCLIAEKNNKLIGTILYKNPRQCNGTPFYNNPHVAMFGQLAIEPKLQRQGIGSQLMKIVEELAEKDGAGEIACNTSKDAIHLVEFYKKRGYHFIEFVSWKDTNYKSVVLSKSLKNPVIHG